MTAYVLRRLAQIIAALFGITTLIFLLLHLQPGGPCNATLLTYAHPGDTARTLYQAAPPQVNCIDYFHLDRPLVEQYSGFIGNYLHGNLGISLQSDATPVGTIIGEHLPTSILLIAVAFLIQQIIALPLGVFAAVHRHSVFDGIFSVLSYVALATPAFVLGLLLIFFVAVDWGAVPTGRASNVTLPILFSGSWFQQFAHQPALLLGDAASHLVLPAITLAVIGIALDSRFMRAAMLQVLDEEYIRTAKAKGLKRRTIIFKHAFRNALPPIISNIALYVPALIGNAMVVETVFSYTGLGYTFSQAIQENNTTLEQAIFLLSTAAVLVANLAADIAYGVADPRVRYE